MIVIIILVVLAKISTSLSVHGNRILTHGCNSHYQGREDSVTNCVNPTGQISHYSNMPSIEPLLRLNFSSICTTESNTVVLTEKGDIYIWGSREYLLGYTISQGDEDYSTPYLFYSSDVEDKIVELKCGQKSVMFRTFSDNIYGWGRNVNSELTGTDVIYQPRLLAQSPFFDIADEVSVITDVNKKTIFTVGYNFFSQLGRSEKSQFDRVTSYEKSELELLTTSTTIWQIYVFQYQVFIQLKDGNIYGWGYNYKYFMYGETGDSTYHLKSPYLIDFYKGGIEDDVEYSVIEISCYLWCVALIDVVYEGYPNRWLYSWGSEEEQFLGRAINDQQSMYFPYPVRLGEMESYVFDDPIVSVQSTSFTTRVLTESGKVFAYGKNNRYGLEDTLLTIEGRDEFMRILHNTTTGFLNIKEYSKHHAILIHDNVLCQGVFDDSEYVCSGHGECISKGPDGICDCLEEYDGIDCQIFSCHGTSNMEKSVCSGRGECVGINNCDCKGLGVGKECETPMCFGETNDNVTVCNGGNCLDSNSCECTETLYGLQCEEKILDTCEKSGNRILVKYETKRSNVEAIYVPEDNCTQIVANMDEIGKGTCSWQYYTDINRGGISQYLVIFLTSYTGEKNLKIKSLTRKEQVVEVLVMERTLILALIIVPSVVVGIILICLVTLAIAICVVLGFVVVKKGNLKLPQKGRKFNFSQLKNIKLSDLGFSISFGKKVKLDINESYFDIEFRDIKFDPKGGNNKKIEKGEWIGEWTNPISFEKTRLYMIVLDTKEFTKKDKEDFEARINVTNALSHDNVFEFVGCWKFSSKIGVCFKCWSTMSLSKYLKRKGTTGFTPLQRVNSLLDLVEAIEYFQTLQIKMDRLTNKNIRINDEGVLGLKFDNFRVGENRFSHDTFTTPEEILNKEINDKKYVYQFGIICKMIMSGDCKPLFGKTGNIDREIMKGPKFTEEMFGSRKLFALTEKCCSFVQANRPTLKKAGDDLEEIVKKMKKRIRKKQKKQNKMVKEKWKMENKESKKQEKERKQKMQLRNELQEEINIPDPNSDDY